MNNIDKTKDVTSWFTVLFVPSITEKFKKFNREDIKVSYYSCNKLSKFIKIQKDSHLNWSKNNVVYKIMYKDCVASYVGQTVKNNLKSELQNTVIIFVEYIYPFCNHRT